MMNSLKEITKTVEKELLIAFADLTNFAKVSAKHSSTEVFEYITKIYEMTGECVENAGGVVIKFIGDESLCVFPESNIDKGILALLQLKDKIDDFNRSQGMESQLKIKCHFGAVAIGHTGCRSDKRLDIMGNEVNACAVMKSNGFAMSAETFRKLNPETRKHFKKHTPPITYIPIEERHKD
jgi:class 3 adenylate cyclase